MGWLAWVGLRWGEVGWGGWWLVCSFVGLFTGLLFVRSFVRSFVR